MTVPGRIKTASETFSADYNIAQMLNQPNGFEKIALEQLPPFIRETRDYEAFGRKVLMVHNITSEDTHLIDGEPYVYYPKDENARAAFYADDAEVPRQQIESDGVNVRVLTIMSDNVTISVKRLMVQKYQYLERARELAGIAMARAEDVKIIEMVERLLQGSGTTEVPEEANQIVIEENTSLLKNDMIEMMKKITQWDIPVGHFVFNPATAQDMLKWGFGTEGGDIDQLTQREMIESGIKYSFWKVPIVTSRIVPKTLGYCFADKEYVGRMPILKDLTVMLTERAERLEKGLFMYEFAGFYLANSHAVSKVVMGYNSSTNKDLIHLPSDKDGVYARGAEILGVRDSGARK